MGGKEIITVTTDTLPGKRIFYVFGMIHAELQDWNRGNDFDVIGDLRCMLEKKAIAMGVTAIVGFRILCQEFIDWETGSPSTQFVAYGTPVIFENGDHFSRVELRVYE